VKRLFIAVKTEPEGDLIRMISSSKSLLGSERIKWVDPDNIHITLSFLGDTSEKRLGALSLILEEACKDFGMFEFKLTGLGVFKNIRDPRVIWVGIHPKDTLIKLGARISEGLRISGFQIEERTFNPHLTIGRINSLKEPESLKRILESYRNTEFQIVEAKEVILYESILMQSGPLYKPLGKYRL